MFLVHLVGMILHLAELAFAAIVTGLTGFYLHAVDNGTVTWDQQGRFIYTEVVAGLSVFLALVWLVPFSLGYVHYPVDLLLAVAWFVAFGLLVDWLHGTCGAVFDWSGIAIDGHNRCAEWKADIAFCFLSAVCWLASSVLGAYWLHRHGYDAPAAVGHRRRWYRARV